MRQPSLLNVGNAILALVITLFLLGNFYLIYVVVENWKELLAEEDSSNGIIFNSGQHHHHHHLNSKTILIEEGDTPKRTTSTTIRVYVESITPTATTHRHRSHHFTSSTTTPPAPTIQTRYTHSPLSLLETTESPPKWKNPPMIKVTAAEVRRYMSPPYSTSTGTGTVTTQPTPPTPTPTTTLVTALLDIGREKWPHYGRLLSTYQQFMRNVLMLRMPMVVFVDAHSYEFVQQVRESIGLSHQTLILEATVDQLPLYKYKDQMAMVMDRELKGDGWSEEWDDSLKTHPESCQVLYDVLVNSKAYFLYNASQQNPFNTTFFTWLDAGYGHGHQAYFPSNFKWTPSFLPNRISIIKLTPSWDKLPRYSIKELYRKNVAVLSGGFVAGDGQTLRRFHQHYHWKVIEMLSRHAVVDDDQTMLVMLANEWPSMFNVVEGNWFDAFRLF